MAVKVEVFMVTPDCVLQIMKTLQVSFAFVYCCCCYTKSSLPVLECDFEFARARSPTKSACESVEHFKALSLCWPAPAMTN